MIEQVFKYIMDNPAEKVAIATVITALVTTGVKSFIRRPIKTSQGGAFLTNSELLKPPISRPAYSDRMAYLLAEMSALAYFKFEDSGDGALQQAVEKFQQQEDDENSPSEENIRGILEEFRDDLLIYTTNSKDILSKILERAGFELLDTIDVGTTQGFVCKRVKKGETPYLVVAFRGSEMDLGDWLTNTNAVPEPRFLTDGIKVHKGFWEALNCIPKGKPKNVLDKIREILKRDDVKDGERILPCYFTGHSLGGALALITTCEIAPDINGACYNYGAPRVANYKYFTNMKTPVYRVVNSSDIVPRVPPGALMGILLKLVQGLNWLTQFIPGAAKLWDWIEQKVDQLNGYRHHGDLRYLTDVRTGKFEDVRLLSNPPMIDRVWWMWQHIRKSLHEPIKSHGMAIYRHKMQHIATTRNPERRSIQP